MKNVKRKTVSPHPRQRLPEDANMPQFSLSVEFFSNAAPKSFLYLVNMSSPRLIDNNDFQLLFICPLFHVNSIFPFLLPPPPLQPKLPEIPWFQSSTAGELIAAQSLARVPLGVWNSHPSFPRTLCLGTPSRRLSEPGRHVLTQTRAHTELSS